MKSCPHCGNALSKDDTTFCPNCGKQLSVQKHTASKAHSKKKKKTGRRQRTPGKYEKKPAEPIPEIMGEPVDDGYDGYYNDVLPPDLERTREGLDKELIKKISALIIVVIFVIGMCVALLYIL